MVVKGCLLCILGTMVLLLAGASCDLLALSQGNNQQAEESTQGPSTQPAISLPVQEIQDSVQVQGTVMNGVLDLSVERKDIPAVDGPEGQNVTFTPAFELNGDIFFQPLDNGQAFMNGDMPLKESEVNPFVSKLWENGLVWQAFHQHLPMHPQVWFVHFRGAGDPVAIAQGIKAALDVTSIPFPQAPPSNPQTPLDANRLASILHGSASVGSEGVVTVWVLRTDTITISGVDVNPQTNISTNIQFKPLGDSQSGQAAAVPDFAMTADETLKVIPLMLDNLGWYQGCLYNQETDEHPQLYFDHMLKIGDPYVLAAEIRQGLDLTASE